MTHVTGKTVLITGASRGIGAAAARHLAAAGAKVALAARSKEAVERLASDLGAQALALTCDVADWDQASSAVAKTIETFGAIDGLVNNAGLIDPIARIEEVDPLAWDQVIDVNVKGAFHMLRAVAPGMVARGAGVVVNISSGAATSALEGWSHYCASKAALLSLTRTAHKELSPKGVSVVGLSPGTVATDMQRRIKQSGINPVSQLAWEAHIPTDYVARAIAYLLGPNGRQHDGGDFSIKTDEGRKAVGLPSSS
ncbi:MAG: SDR family oxidoreductase [Pseudomonadota bacterium]